MVAQIAHILSTPLPAVLAMYWDETLRWWVETLAMTGRMRR